MGKICEECALLRVPQDGLLRAFTGAHCCNATPAQHLHLHLDSHPAHLPRGQQRHHLCPEQRLGPTGHAQRQTLQGHSTGRAGGRGREEGKGVG